MADNSNTKVDKEKTKKVRALMSSYRDGLGNIYTTKDGQLHIKATSGIMATWTFHEYLKRFANVHISWDHRQINFDVLPKITNFTLIPQDLIRFYQNPCLYGYSFAFWSWSQVPYARHYNLLLIRDRS